LRHEMATCWRNTMRKLVTSLVVLSFCLVSQFAIAAATTVSLILVTYAQVGSPNALVRDMILRKSFLTVPPRRLGPTLFASKQPTNG